MAKSIADLSFTFTTRPWHFLSVTYESDFLHSRPTCDHVTDPDAPNRLSPGLTTSAAHFSWPYPLGINKKYSKANVTLQPYNPSSAPSFNPTQSGNEDSRLTYDDAHTNSVEGRSN